MLGAVKLPFWLSIAALSLVQGGVVALPAAGAASGRLRFLRARQWALIPPLSVVGFVLAARAAERASAQTLTYLALVAVPPLAAAALGTLAAGARPALALLAIPLFALAWADRAGLAGEGAALILSAMSCVALGALIAAVTPARWLGAGIIAMAAADTALVVADQLQRPNRVLQAAHPAAGLPRLQSVVFGSAGMGYGDLFIAGLLGGLLAARLGRAPQVRAALLAAALALAFDLLFFFVDELPATVPVALTLIALSVHRSGPRRSLELSDGARGGDPRTACAPRAADSGGVRGFLFFRGPRPFALRGRVARRPPG